MLLNPPQYAGWPPTKNDWTLNVNSAEGTDLYQNKHGHYLTFWNESNVTMHHGATAPALPQGGSKEWVPTQNMDDCPDAGAG